jgi:hypothetical protein
MTRVFCRLEYKYEICSVKKMIKKIKIESHLKLLLWIFLFYFYDYHSQYCSIPCLYCLFSSSLFSLDYDIKLLTSSFIRVYYPSKYFVMYFIACMYLKCTHLLLFLLLLLLFIFLQTCALLSLAGFCSSPIQKNTNNNNVKLYVFFFWKANELFWNDDDESGMCVRESEWVNKSVCSTWNCVYSMNNVPFMHICWKCIFLAFNISFFS